MAALIGIFRKGEDVRIGLDAVAGDPASVDAVTAVMRRVRVSGASVVIDRGEPIEMVVSFREAGGGDPPGWTFVTPAEVTRTLDVGTYGIDARLEIGGAIEITDDTAVVQLTEGMLS